MSSTDLDATRRRFLGYCSAIGVSGTLLPGVLWARVQDTRDATKPPRVTEAMLKDALAVAGLEFSEEDTAQMVNGVNQALTRYEELRAVHIDPDLQPPLYYSPLVPGTRLDRTPRPFRLGPVPQVRRPARLEDVAFWPLTHLAELVRTRQVTATELTGMYLDRLHRHNAAINCVVTFTDDLAKQQAAAADAEIAAGRYRGPLHGIPWGCKDIIAVPGYPTTWGSDAFRDQHFDYEASVVRLLREAGAVLLAKLATGELASGDRWFGGQTMNPWDLKEGASGSSCGPASATAAGLVAFGIGTDTGGSVLFPATRCGIAGLRPTFGRVSRHGAMALSWTRDRIGPLCRTPEDCAVVFHAIARADEQDLTVQDLPFNYDGQADVRSLRVGYLEPTGVEEGRTEDWQANDRRTLDQLRSMGVKPERFEMPELPLELAGVAGGAESGASFDELLRSGRDRQLTIKTRGNGLRASRLIPAVEYLQGQRVRAKLMRDYAAVVGKYDVFIQPSNNPPLNPTGGVGAGPDGRSPRPQTRTRYYHELGNSCCYPAVTVPNGFTSAGKPTTITFVGRLYAEAQLLALAAAYTRSAGPAQRYPRSFTTATA